jgi:hypothetical protein
MTDYTFAYLGLTLETAYELQRKDLVPIAKETLASLLVEVAKPREKPIKLNAANYPTGFTLSMAHHVEVKFEFQKGMEFGVDFERSADNERVVIYLQRLK